MAKKPLRFNKAQIKKILGDVNTEYLFLAGQTVRSKARSSLKVRKKNEVSKAGEVPKLHKSNSPLKSLLLYAFDPGNLSMVIGSAIFQSRSTPQPAPKILERGGSITVKRKVYQPAHRRKWGADHYSKSRPQNYTYFTSTEAHKKAIESSGFKAWRDKQKPVYKQEQVTIEPRPYMSKALKQVLSAGVSKWLYQKAVQRASKSYTK